MLLLILTLLTTPQAIPDALRDGIKADRATIQQALAMRKQGWVYIMPEPKSKQARWGNSDGRTTWWIGYWVNRNTNQTSVATPAKNAQGIYQGDNQSKSWRRGGTPGPPSKLEWLLSVHGGIKPR